jgi:hypothetical protein
LIICAPTAAGATPSPPSKSLMVRGLRTCDATIPIMLSSLAYACV